MKSSKQRRAELQTERDARRKKAEAAKITAEKRKRVAFLAAKAREGVAVNTDTLASYNSYGSPAFVERGYYIDLEFTCHECGRAEIWTAAQQKWWYEVAKGQVYSTAKLCRECRRRERKQRAEAGRLGDPNPIKHPAVLLARVRDAIAPTLEAASFQFHSRNNPRDRAGANLWIDWTRDQNLVSLRWDRREAILSLEMADENETVQTLASVCISGLSSSKQLMQRINRFVDDCKNTKNLR